MKKQEANKTSDSWNAFQKDKKRNVASNAAKKALELFASRKGFAVDIGCGAGADSLLMLDADWKVMALDYNTLGINIVYEGLEGERKGNLIIVEDRFENMKLPICNWLNASFALPFVQAKDYPEVWKKVKDAIEIGGRFSGTFFGNKDSWAHGNTKKTFHTKEQVMELFKDFEIEWFEEREHEGKSIDSEGIEHPKHWHTFEVVSRKIRGGI